MNRSSLITYLFSAMALGTVVTTALAQDGYVPSYRGYPPPPAPSPGGYSADPVNPYVGGYTVPGGYDATARPYAGGYNSARPFNPYAGSSPAGLYTTNPVYSRGYSLPGVPAPGDYGYAPNRSASPYGQVYPLSPSVPAQVYQRGYSLTAVPTPGAYNDVLVQPFGPGGGAPAPYSGPSPVAGLAVQLVQQVDDFLRSFTQTVRAVPQGGLFLADATTLREAAARLSQMAASGASPAALSVQFRTVAATWQRFELRMEQVAKGRMGPNIAKILQMGSTVDQIQSVLP